MQGIPPYVVRAADPLVIRVDEMSLLVGSSNFYAKVKIGLPGYMIYCSGLGTPILTKEIPLSGTVQMYDGGTGNVTTEQKLDQLNEAAKKWIDDLEDSFSDIDTDSSIKAAIDRLCWQLHYDITKTSANMPQDMANVDIDKTADTVNDYNSTMSTDLQTIAGNLRGEGEYTISKALRDSSTSDVSISNQIKLQQAALSQTLNSMDSTLTSVKTNTDNISGDTGSIKSSSTTIVTNTGNTATNTSNTAANTNNIVNNTNYLSGISNNVSTISTKVSNIETDTDTIKTKVNSAFVTISTTGGNVDAFRTYGSTNGW